MAGRRWPGSRRTTSAAIYYYILWPMAFLSIHPDYLLVHRLVPSGPGADARDVRLAVRGRRRWRCPTSTRRDAVAFWDLTNGQDWHVCELQQRGTRSSSWVAGRYSNQEFPVHAFDRMVVDRYVGDPFLTSRVKGTRGGEPIPTVGVTTNGTDGANGHGAGGDGPDRDARKAARSKAAAER